jgi:hypothetical protein
MTSPEITDAAVEAQTDAEFLAETFTEAWGERCLDYVGDCACCVAWKRFDSIAAALATGRAEAVAAGWQTMETAPEVGSKFIALYNDGSGGVLFFRHDGGYIDHDGEDWSIVDSSKFERWTYLPAGFEFWCEGAPEPVELPEWKGPGSALVSAPAAPSDGLGQFKPSVTVNEEAGLTEATFEDVPFVAQPVLPGVHHWIDKYVAMDDGRLVGIAIWATKPPAAPAAEAEPGSSFWGAPEHERGRMLSRIRELETALTAPSASHEALREALRVMKDTYANCAGLTEADKRAHALADAALAQSAPVKAGG